ncbi:hypothetical protein H2201_001867 [Coniosporium apollinis]|uniref:IBR domain-containing protein n=1 Tax=Coniosporium apollinis TaxID=61459 RepID=A0ABQ9P411_9PEZI|nr:hypothetical protein H2201_001867 [Coniosporium apollinis]
MTTALAASPTTFCKCTCAGNSTIIALDGAPPTTTSPPHALLERKPGGRTCSDCNRQFCLDYNLPKCKNAKEEEVFTTCFQRDSAKDEAVVFIFIFTTVGLLVYAAVRPWVEQWAEKFRERRSYIPVASGEQ